MVGGVHTEKSIELFAIRYLLLFGTRLASYTKPQKQTLIWCNSQALKPVLWWVVLVELEFTVLLVSLITFDFSSATDRYFERAGYKSKYDSEF